MDEFKKEELMDKIAHALDITPQMYNESQKFVRGLEAYLRNQIPSLQVYKQGSFRLGTIIRPFKKDKDGEFDIDLVVQFSVGKNATSPSQIKQTLRNCLTSQNYRIFLEEEKRRCWTLDHKSGSSSFHVDLLPCVDESSDVKNTIVPTSFKDTAIAITEIIDKDVKPYRYKWMTSNPKGYAKWFDNINYGVYKEIKAHDRERIFKENPTLFESVNMVGDDFTRSPLQKVIQILKRHRDVMYCNNQENAPISIIITTLVGKIVEENNTEIINNTYTLLNFVLEGLSHYAKLTTSGITSDFDADFNNKKLITKKTQNGKVYWSIKNPANSQENLAEKWNESPEKAIEFFKWVRKVKEDLIDILDLDKYTIIEKLKFCLGESISNHIFEHFSFDSAKNAQTKILNFNQNTPKPYRI